MPRAQRLLALLQELRCHRYPVRGTALADALAVSLRTLYRDVATLRAQGARIDGEPGVGYVLRPGFTLPPLTFTEDEVEALVLGARWVVDRADAPLGDAARHALAKIRAVLPATGRAALEDTTLLVGPGVLSADAADRADDGVERARLTVIRRAMRAERKLAVTYRDLGGHDSERTVWPFALAFFDRARVVVGWCELRQGYRHFRTDRIRALAPLEVRYPRRRHALLREWRELEGIGGRAADTI